MKGQELRPLRPNYRDKSCLFEGCVNRPQVDQLCYGHVTQRDRKGVLSPLRSYKIGGGTCDYEGCDRRLHANNKCSIHRKMELSGKPLRAINKRAQIGETRIKKGYVYEKDPTHPNAKRGWVRQHVKVMSDHLGRRILSEQGENVHHINGDKTDNRIENLELWLVGQPPGQRIEDLIPYWKMMLERYDKN